MEALQADASVIYVPAPKAAAAVIEAIDAVNFLSYDAIYFLVDLVYRFENKFTGSAFGGVYYRRNTTTRHGSRQD